ncbi:MAG: DUF58 domain-containing protein [Roseburia sp.]|nr:DUF58 domain-containing protein [Roseburia sp.]
MVKNWIIYIIVFAGLTVFSIMYIKQSAFIVLTMAALVPLWYSMITFVLAKKRITASIRTEVLTLEKKKPAKFLITVENRSSVNQGSRAVVYVVVKNGAGIVLCRSRKKLYLVSEREETVFEYVPAHSGINEVIVEKVRVFNGFSLLHSTVVSGDRRSFLIMPEYKEYPIQPETLYDENEGESDRFSAAKPGNDPTELYDIRTYKPGDKLSHVNWKFTAKNSQLMVQDYGFPIACDTAVFLDVCGERDMDKLETVSEILYYLMVKFVLVRKIFYVIWKDFREETVKRKMISDNDDIYELFQDLFRAEMSGAGKNIEDIYSMQYEGEFLSGSILIYSGRKEIEDEIIRQKLRTDKLQLVCV